MIEAAVGTRLDIGDCVGVDVEMGAGRVSIGGAVARTNETLFVGVDVGTGIID